MKMPRLTDLLHKYITDVHFGYGFYNGNARAAAEKYQPRYSGIDVLLRMSR